jgi:hypothetical protein
MYVCHDLLYCAHLMMDQFTAKVPLTYMANYYFKVIFHIAECQFISTLEYIFQTFSRGM